MPGAVFQTQPEQTTPSQTEENNVEETQNVSEQPSAPTKKFCTQCGTEAVGNFCGNCGAKIQ